MELLEELRTLRLTLDLFFLPTVHVLLRHMAKPLQNLPCSTPLIQGTP